MADNTTLDAGTGGDTIGTDDIGGVKYQRVKLIQGADGTNDGDVASANPLPTDQREVGGVAVPVDNAAFTDGTTPVQPVGYIFDDVAGTALTENDVAAARIDSKRAQVLVIEDETTRGRGATVSAANALKVDGSGVTQPVSGTVTVTHPALGGGIESGAQRVTIANDSTGLVSVDDAGGSLTVDGTVTADAGTGDFLSISGHTTNEALKESTAIGGHLDDTATTAATEGNVAPVRITAQRGLHANLRAADGTEVTIGGGVEAAALRVTLANDSTGLLSIDDNGGSLTVDGTVTVTHPALGGGVEAGAQRVTIANDSTGVLSVDDAGGSLTVDGTVTADAGTGFPAVVTEDAAAAGGETGTQALGVRRDADTSPVTADGDFHSMIYDAVGNLKVNVKVGSASGTEYTEDAAAPGNPAGGVQQLVRLDTPAAITGADNDIVSRRGTNFGAAYTQMLDSSGNFIDTFGGGTQYTEDAASAANPVGNQMIARRRDSPASETTADGDVTALNCTDEGSLHTELRSGTAETGVVANPLVVTDDGNAILVDGSAVTQPVSGTVTVTHPALGGGVEAGAQRVTIANDSTGLVSVDDGGGALTVDGTVTADAGTGTRDCGGDVAHDAADSGNPVSAGLHAVEFASAPPTVTADDDRVRAIATPQGIQWTLGGHPNIISREYMATTAQTNDPISDTVAAGSHIVVTEIEALVDNATTVDVGVRIGFGATAVPTEPADGAFVDGMVLSHPGIAAGSGVVRGNGGAAIAVGADGAELRITSEVPTTGKLRVLVSFYVATL